MSLEARVDTTHFSGRISKQIYIDSNDPTAPSAVVTIQGEVVPLQAHNITLGDLKYLFFLIVDIRSPDAYAACHLLGAMNIPSAQLPLWIDILPRDIILVVYDDTGTDSASQAKYLQSVGFPTGAQPGRRPRGVESHPERVFLRQRGLPEPRRRRRPPP